MAQLQENSAETALRMGNVAELRGVLGRLPLRLSCGADVAEMRRHARRWAEMGRDEPGRGYHRASSSTNGVHHEGPLSRCRGWLQGCTTSLAPLQGWGWGVGTRTTAAQAEGDE